jgi:hypothetical protein
MNRTKIVAALALLTLFAFLALLGAGCQWGAANSAPNTCDPQWGDNECTTCAKTSCCEEITACVSDLRCQGLRFCRSRGTPLKDCISSKDGQIVATKAQIASGLAKFEAVQACWDARCGVACGLGGEQQPDGGT